MGFLLAAAEACAPSRTSQSEAEGCLISHSWVASGLAAHVEIVDRSSLWV